MTRKGAPESTPRVIVDGIRNAHDNAHDKPFDVALYILAALRDAGLKIVKAPRNKGETA